MVAPNEHAANPDQRDNLTGLLNEEGLKAKLDYLATTRPGWFSVLVVDVDDLKPTNDKLGHDAGNELLIKSADIMATSVRTERERVEFDARDGSSLELDSVAVRIHGDEFAIVLPGVVGLVDLDNIRDRVEANLDEAGIKASVDGRPHVPGESASDLLKSADKAMLARKKARKLARFNSLPRWKKVAARTGERLLRIAGMSPPRI